MVESGQLSALSDPRTSSIYRQALAAGLIGAEPDSPSTSSASIDREVTPEQKGGTIDDNRQCVLQIGGMWCSSCAWLIEHSLAKQRGVVKIEVSFSSDTARVIYKPARTDETVLTKAITGLGFTAVPFGDGNDSDPRVAARRKDLLRVVIAFAFATNVMMMQLILYAGFFEGISGEMRSGLPWLLLALSIPVVAASSPIFYRAFKAAQSGIATMETLVALGAGAALSYSLWQTVAGSGHVYYDTADMLLGLVMVGKYIERGARQSANNALTMLYGLLPKKAVVIRGDAEYPVAISQLADGDMVLVKSGERIAADGTIMDGAATVDESLLSGESRPVNKRAGDHAIGGTILMNGVLTVRVERVGDAGTLNQIIRHVEDALQKKTPSERMADQVSRVFVPIVLFLALLSGALLAVIGHGGVDAILTRVVAVLVIACPCALGIATPMAISAGVASAARSGMLVSDGGAFETLKRITHIVLDKTGTATEAIFEVRRTFGNNDDSHLLKALESRSSHPISAALTSYISDDKTSPVEVVDFEITDGAGISAKVDGRSVFAGNLKALFDAGLKLSPDEQAFADECSVDGMTVVCWGIAGDGVRGIFALGDRLRPDAAKTVADLALYGITAELLSGDSPATTAYIAKQMSITEFRGGASPKDKAEIVEELRSRGNCVCMVGDGVNDAPALAQADVGVALASGTDIAARTAQVTLLKPDLTLLPKLIRLSRRTVGVMHLNLFWAFLYNTVCIPLAMLGYVTPIWAVIAMLVSSLTVILNTQRLMRG